MKKFNIRNTHFFNIFYRICIYAFFGVFYDYVIPARNRGNINLKYLSLAIMGIAVIIYFFVDGYTEFGTINSILSRGYVIVLSTLSLFSIVQSNFRQSLRKSPAFLIGIGLLIPTAVSVIWSLFTEDLYSTNFVLYAKSVIARNMIGLLGECAFAMAFFYSRFTKIKYF